ncbi:TetR/AcrR family transcriptional regulator [Crassaminicella profunda]|uniref:TetR/AcrR family transcriptional regulator n=1 Tax=Crassaminicella profunda TaxID=1286698 RepID=UPI001CA74395|nr:TetR/AcrR family transcriptional regulator [Crassaminicella profunda]QZY55949.1 TetR/AcrR family transcriptional regulator [Crassaminicella profunda]
MTQILKKEIYDRIFDAGLNIFYEKDFRSTKMKEIADKAGISVGLVYSYFKNKEKLFDAIVSPVYMSFEKMLKEEELSMGLPSEKYENISKDYILELIENHKILVILMDKSKGTKHENAKDSLIKMLENHIRVGLSQFSTNHYDDMLIHILASNFTESILEIARHYKNKNFAREMLTLVTKCYYNGVDSL